jgi:hypothetical protein
MSCHEKENGLYYGMTDIYVVETVSLAVEGFAIFFPV